jgi:hypothetical protein
MPSATIPLGQFTFGPSSLGLPVNFGFQTNIAGTLTVTDTASNQTADIPVSLGVSGNTGGEYWFFTSGPGLPGTPIGDHFYSAGNAFSQQISPAGTAVGLDIYLDFADVSSGPTTFPPVDGVPQPVDVPEPSALLLAAGLIILGRAAWRTMPPQ